MRAYVFLQVCVLTVLQVRRWRILSFQVSSWRTIIDELEQRFANLLTRIFELG